VATEPVRKLSRTRTASGFTFACAPALQERPNVRALRVPLDDIFYAQVVDDRLGEPLPRQVRSQGHAQELKGGAT